LVALDETPGSGEERSPEPAKTHQKVGDRASWPGHRRLLVAGALIVCLGGGAAAVAVGASAGSSPHRLAVSARYGGIPSWIPKAKLPVGRVVHASPRHPWLAIEGDGVDVALPGGTSYVTAVGPQVPAADIATNPLKTRVPCTFDFTFARTAGSIPIRPGDFTIIDELGQLHHPKVTLVGGGRAPAHLRTRAPLTLSITSVLPVGAGMLRWAPLHGRPVVSWDFDVEVD
jgi:hypothetical protein